MNVLEKPSAPVLEIKDISRRALVVLVLLTVIVSLIGSFLVLNEVSHSRVIVRETQPAFGTVALTITKPNEGQESLKESGVTGFVALSIEPNPDRRAQMEKGPALQPPADQKYHQDQKYYYYGGKQNGPVE